MQIRDLILRHGPRARRAVLLVVIFGMPTFFLYGFTFDAFNVPKFALLVSAISLVGSIRLAEFLLGRQDHTLTLLKVPVLATALPLIVAWIFSPYREWSLLGRYTRFEGLIPYLLILIAAVLIADAFRAQPRPVASALVMAGTVVGIYAFLQALGLDPLAQSELTDYPFATVGHSNFLGGLLAILLPVSIGLTANAGSRSRPWSLCAIGISIGLILSFSQGGWGAAVAGVGVTTALMSKRNWLRATALITAGATAALMVGLVVYGILVPTSRVVGNTTLTRSLVWETAITMTLDDPVTGGGPNAFAVDGTQHRSPLAAIYHGRARPDGPHSVPLAWAANAGLLGLGGFAVTTFWWVRRARSGLGYVQAGLAGGLAAYLVQSFVSFDELLLGFVFWVLLAAFAASIVPRAETNLNPSPVSAPARFLAPALIVIPLAAMWWAMNFVLADARFLAGMDAFRERAVSVGEAKIDSALAFRDDYYYRSQYGFELFRAAVRSTIPASERDRLHDKATAAYSFLDRFPDVNSMADKAFWLHQSSLQQPSDAPAALELLERARTLDPYEVGLMIQMADVYVTLGSPERAVDIMVEARDLLEEHPPFGQAHTDAWGALAIGLAESGRESEAAEALEKGLELENLSGMPSYGCHLLVAQLLLDMSITGTPDDLLATARLSCPSAILEILDGPSR